MLQSLFCQPVFKQFFLWLHISLSECKLFICPLKTLFFFINCWPRIDFSWDCSLICGSPLLALIKSILNFFYWQKTDSKILAEFWIPGFPAYWLKSLVVSSHGLRVFSPVLFVLKPFAFALKVKLILLIICFQLSTTTNTILHSSL